MSNDELILQKLAEISDRLVRIEEKQDAQTEVLAEHSAAFNTLIEWADDFQSIVKIPFGK
jgi:hypothetical protein